MLEKVLVAAKWQANKHAVGDARDHVHRIVPDWDLLVVGGIEAPGGVEAVDDLIVDSRDDVIYLARERLVNDMFVVDGFQKVWCLVLAADFESVRKTSTTMPSLYAVFN